MSRSESFLISSRDGAQNENSATYVCYGILRRTVWHDRRIRLPWSSENPREVRVTERTSNRYCRGHARFNRNAVIPDNVWHVYNTVGNARPSVFSEVACVSVSTLCQRALLSRMSKLVRARGTATHSQASRLGRSRIRGLHTSSATFEKRRHVFSTGNAWAPRIKYRRDGRQIHDIILGMILT